ncbi:MAG: hypothetical protein IT311_10550 [Anaerolineales bacterium]|nr:hypothetical protein [Anaerolineales bacterium]MCZ2121079.1 hypothetical protein [Anaerolineales bacterium]
MPLITFFTAPKPFTNPHIAMIQRNALKSWTLLEDVEIILLGDEAGIAEIAKEFNLKHFPDVQMNENGTPLISSMFAIARANTTSELLCIVNADMILMSDFVEAARRSRMLRDEFVLLSQRWDYDITSPLDFAAGWESGLRESVRKQNRLHRPAGSDFFLFPKSCYQDIPNFTIGRAGWDNWMIYKARKENWAVIDCTPALMIVHQNHDYSHLPNGKPHYDHPDTNVNIRLAGGQANVRYSILDSTHQLINDKLARPKLTSLRFTRKFELVLRTIFFFLPETMIENVVRPKRWKKRFKKIIG